MPDAHSELHYAPKSSPHAKVIRRSVIALLVVVAVVVLSPLLVKEFHRQRTLRLYDKCAMGASDLHPHAWIDLNRELGSYINTSGTVFLGKLRAPKTAVEYLVGIDITGWTNEIVTTRARTIMRQSAPLSGPIYGPASDQSFVLDKTARISAGVVDPGDPSHFTIDYTGKTNRGVIDGWLRDDGSITLEPREPAATAPAPPSPVKSP